MMLIGGCNNTMFANGTSGLQSFPRNENIMRIKF